MSRALAVDSRLLVTNLVTRNPRGAAFTSVSGAFQWTNARWFGAGGATGTHSNPTGQTTPFGASQTIARKTWSSNVTAGNSNDTGFGASTTGLNGYPVVAGDIFYLRAWVRTSASSKHTLPAILRYDGAGASLARVTASPAALTPNTWTPVTQSYVVPAGVSFLAWAVDVVGNQAGGTGWAIGDTLDATGLLVTKATVPHEFFDGASTAAKWLGTTNASASVGYPALL